MTCKLMIMIGNQVQVTISNASRFDRYTLIDRVS